MSKKRTPARFGAAIPKLVYIVDWLPPDYGAIGQYALKEARERASAGERVHLFGLSSTASSVESVAIGAGRLTVVRLHAIPFDRTDFKRRAVWTLRTNARLVAAALSEMRTADEVLFTASPPFLEHLIVPLKPLLRGSVVFRVADVHPEALMKEMKRIPSWLGLLHQLTLERRRGADVIEVLGEDQRQLMIEGGVRPERIVLRRSGPPVVWDDAAMPFERPASFGRKTLLLYSGAVGHAHDIATFLDGYALHHHEGSGRVAFWLNADGAFADQFERAVRERGLPIHRSQPVPLSDFCRLMATVDAHLITLKDAYVGLVVPSKVYGCIASQKQILFVGSPRCDVDLLCREQCSARYLRADVGAPRAVAIALEELADRARGTGGSEE